MGTEESREDVWRRTMVQLVAAKPGASTRELATAVQLSESTVDYHLRKLKREGAVVSDANGRALAWFLAGGGYCPVLRKAMALARRDDARAMLSSLAPDLPVTSAGLARTTGATWGAARWTMQLLVDAGIVERGRTGRCMLAPGAETCRAKALASERCDQWGGCEVSKKWMARQREEERARGDR